GVRAAVPWASPDDPRIPLAPYAARFVLAAGIGSTCSSRTRRPPGSTRIVTGVPALSAGSLRPSLLGLPRTRTLTSRDSKNERLLPLSSETTRIRRAGSYDWIFPGTSSSSSSAPSGEPALVAAAPDPAASRWTLLVAVSVGASSFLPGAADGVRFAVGF